MGGPSMQSHRVAVRLISSAQAAKERRIDIELGKTPQAAVGIEGAIKGVHKTRRSRPQPSLAKLKFMEGDGS